MKKRIVCTCLSMVMALLLAFPLAGCGSSESNEKSTIYYFTDTENGITGILCFDNGIDSTYDPTDRELSEITEEGTLHIAEIEGKTDIIIPDTIRGLPIMAIDGGAFNDCSSLKSIQLPDNIAIIEPGAFDGCSKDLILYGKKGSVVEECAKEFNITFKEKGE